MFGRKGKKGNYAYTVARVKAKKSALLKEDAYSKMLMMSLPEISRFISESGYQKEITELTGKYNGVDLIEHATYANMANLFKGILDSAEGELKDMIAADLERWDAWNLKVILRGKSYGLDMEQMKEDLVPAGKLGLAQLETLMGYGSEEEIIQAYGKFVDLAIPQNVLATYGEEKNLAVIEDYLDKAYYERLLLNVDPSSRPKRLFQDFIRNEIDITNLETILKLKKEGITGDVILGYYIPGGAQIDKKLATQLAINPNTIQRAYRELESEGYIYTVAGRGTFVAEHKDIQNDRQDELFKEFDELVTELLYLEVSKEKICERVKSIAEGSVET